jgi:excisionase family DNA binding protein
MQANDNSKAFFTIDELAARWGCQRNTVAAAIKAGRLRAFKVNARRYRISAAEVARYELANTTQAAS